MSVFDLLLSAVLTLALHATVLLGAVWLLERLGGLRHPGWAEFAWRAALLGAFVSTPVQVIQWAGFGADANTPTIAAFRPADPMGARHADAVARAPDSPTTATRTTRPLLPTDSTSVASPVTTPRVSPAANANSDDPSAAWTSSPYTLPDGIALALFAAWLAAIALGALRLAAQASAIRRLGRHAGRHGLPPSAALCVEVDQAAAVLEVPAPALRLLDGLVSPMLLPGRRLLLPAWVPALSSEQRRALLAHELAHLQRRDPAWRVLQRVAALPLCFHPLAWHALARLDALAEDACDARAARLAGSGRPLAECLAACLHHAGRLPAPVLAVAMADQPGPVVRRVQNLLEDPPMSDRPVSPVLRRSAIALGLAVAIALPGIAVTTYVGRALADEISEHLSPGNHYRYRTGNGDLNVQLDMRNQVAFNETETDVVRLGKGASFALSETRDGVEREVRIYGKGGVIQREYRVDGEVRPFAEEGRAWLTKTLPSVIREGAIDADARAQRILARGGTPALLAEIGRTQSDYARATYLGLLFSHARLDDAQTDQALQLAQHIKSDFELRNALQSAVGRKDFAAARMPLVLEAAKSIESDFELAELLSTVAEKHRIDNALRPAWRTALAQIDSDFEHRRVLDALLGRGDVSPATVVLALDGTTGIGSAFELRQVLEAAAPLLRGDAAATTAWFRAASQVDSDFEIRTALQTLLDESPRVDVALADAVLHAVGDIGSDFEAGEALGSLAEKMPDDAALRERYRKEARRLGDFERGQAEKALDRFATT